jgi:protein-S-isoprenylcysteine O-methyltransferase Ste14
MNEQNDHAGVRIPPPVLMLIHLVAAFALNGLLRIPESIPQVVRWAGYLLVATALTLAFSAVNQFRAANTTLDPHGSVGAIITSGPYRFSRNPIYLGFLLLVIGLPLIFGNVWGLLISPVQIIPFYFLIIRHEEEYLARKFGDAYLSYKSGVRRWL